MASGGPSRPGVRRGSPGGWALGSSGGPPVACNPVGPPGPLAQPQNLSSAAGASPSPRWRGCAPVFGAAWGVTSVAWAWGCARSPGSSGSCGLAVGLPDRPPPGVVTAHLWPAGRAGGRAPVSLGFSPPCEAFPDHPGKGSHRYPLPGIILPQNLPRATARARVWGIRQGLYLMGWSRRPSCPQREAIPQPQARARQNPSPWGVCPLGAPLEPRARAR